MLALSSGNSCTGSYLCIPMKREQFKEITRLLSTPVGCSPNFCRVLRRHPGVKLEALISIYSQENQYKVIKSHHVHKSKLSRYCRRYLDGEDCLEISASIDFPPCLLMRRMLEHMLQLSKQAVSDVLRNPDTLLTALKSRRVIPSEVITDALSPTFLTRLQHDIGRCAFADTSYSPFSDIARQITGLEFETLLAKKLTECGVPFWTEKELRDQGFYKTPDVRLQIPIAVLDQSSSKFRTVTWIDSKATFGDDRTHTQQLEQQYRTYVNRYGPGLVIYWFGYIEDLNTDVDVLLLDEFPDLNSIRTLPRLVI